MSSGRVRWGWVVASAAVLALATLFVFLGVWQLGRLGERRIENTMAEEQFTSEVAQLSTLVTGFEPAEIEYRRVFEVGTYDIENEVLIRSQTYRSQAGFHVVTPLVRDDGSAVLVNRGWVPLALDEVPVANAEPVLLEGRVEGWVHLTQTRGALGPTDSSGGRLVQLSRVDIERIQEQVPYSLDPVYMVRIDENGQLPEPLETPQFDDEGAHFSYAMQWFAFTLVLIVGFFALMRRRLSRDNPRD